MTAYEAERLEREVEQMKGEFGKNGQTPHKGNSLSSFFISGVVTIFLCTVTD